MMSGTNTSRSRSQDAEVTPAVPRTDVDAVTLDATVVPVGTFAAGQSEDGRYVAIAAAPQGSFAAGQAENDEATSPEAAETSPKAPPSRAD
jgi:hypothetical protein